MKKLLALSCAILLLICLLPGCTIGGKGEYIPSGDGLTSDDATESTKNTAPQDEPEMDITMVYSVDAGENPFKCSDPSNRAWMSLIYQGLFATDSDYQTWPILCKSYWVSNDMMTWSFYIQDNATFSDGTPLTPEDVLTTLQYAMESDMYRGRFQYVRSLYLTTDGAITFKLYTPYENFAILLDIPILRADQLEADRPLGTGPYRLETAINGMRLVRRTNWWSDIRLPVNASSITLLSESDPAAIRDDFELGNIQVSCADPGDRNYAPYRNDYELWDCETGEFLYLSCNTESWLFETTTIRSVLTYAIDREAIVNEFYDGFAHAATLCASPLSPYYDSMMAARYEYNPEIFNQRIADAQVAYNTITLVVNGNDPQRVRIARRIQAMLEQSGLIVQLETWVGVNYRYILSTGAYDLHLGATKLSPNMDLSAFFSEDGALCYGGLANASISSHCTDALANDGNYYSLLTEIAEDGTLIPILFGSNAVYCQRGMMTDLAPSRDNVFFYNLGVSMSDTLLNTEPNTTPLPEATEPQSEED